MEEKGIWSDLAARVALAQEKESGEGFVEGAGGAELGQTPVWLRERVLVEERGRNWAGPDNGGEA